MVNSTFESSAFGVLPAGRAAPNNGAALRRSLLLVIIFAFGFIVNELELHRVLGFSAPRSAVVSTVMHGNMSTSQPPLPLPLPTPSAAQFSSARQKALDARAALIERAPGRDYRFFTRTMPLTGSEHVLAAKYAHSMSTRSPFVIGVIGTSNAACHDTAVSTCFPSYFRDGIEPLLATFGVPTILRNHAMGGINSIFPSLCLDTLIGDDVDVMLYEFLMSDAGMRCASTTHEMLVRRALQMPKQPVTHFVEIEGGRRDFAMAPFEAAAGEVDSHYDGPNSDYFGPMRERYADFDMHHMHMLDGLHRADHLPGFHYEELFATFHPGPRGHQYLADQLLYYHITAFLMALDLLRDAPAAYVTPRRRPLPPPLFCGEWCASEQPPMCLTSYQPRFRRELSLTKAMNVAEQPYVANATEALALAAERVPLGSGEWRRVLATGEKLHEDRGYVDFKLVWQASLDGGARTFHVSVPQGGVGVVILCSSPPSWGHRPDGHASLASEHDVQYRVDGQSVSPRDTTMVGGLIGCGNQFSESCIALGERLPPGPHQVVVEPLSELYIDVAHVVGA